MKNGDFIVHGKRADELVIKDFKTPSQMTDWEAGEVSYHLGQWVTIYKSVYELYDEVYGYSVDVKCLGDVFGQDFEDEFYSHKTKMILENQMELLKKEKKEIEDSILILQKSIDKLDRV